jgi:hypothetical protein
MKNHLIKIHNHADNSNLQVISIAVQEPESEIDQLHQQLNVNTLELETIDMSHHLTNQ